MKHIKKIILLAFSFLLIIFLTIFSIKKSNNNYKKEIIQEIKNNYQIEEKILEVNKYDHNYVVITKEIIIVLNSKYEKIKEEKKNKLAENKENYKLVYKNNNLMYEKKILKKQKVIYEYYDAYTYEYKDSIILEG